MPRTYAPGGSWRDNASSTRSGSGRSASIWRIASACWAMVSSCAWSARAGAARSRSACSPAPSSRVARARQASTDVNANTAAATHAATARPSSRRWRARMPRPSSGDTSVLAKSGSVPTASAAP